jgi:hypothetical protein
VRQPVQGYQGRIENITPGVKTVNILPWGGGIGINRQALGQGSEIIPGPFPAKKPLAGGLHIVTVLLKHHIPGIKPENPGKLIPHILRPGKRMKQKYQQNA